LWWLHVVVNHLPIQARQISRRVASIFRTISYRENIGDERDVSLKVEKKIWKKCLYLKRGILSIEECVDWVSSILGLQHRYLLKFLDENDCISSPSPRAIVDRQ